MLLFILLSNSHVYLHCWIDLPPSQTRIPVIPWRSVKVYMVSKMHLKNTYFLILRDISYIYVFCTFCLIRTIWSWKYQIIIFIEWICSAFGILGNSTVGVRVRDMYFYLLHSCSRDRGTAICCRGRLRSWDRKGETQSDCPTPLCQSHHQPRHPSGPGPRWEMSHSSAQIARSHCPG